MPFLRIPPTPSDISPAVASPSLIEADGFGGADWISESLDGLRLSLMIEDFRGLVPEGCVEGAGDMVLDGERGVDVPVGAEELKCFFLCFFRLDSLPLVSEAERLGEPGRLR